MKTNSRKAAVNRPSLRKSKGRCVRPKVNISARLRRQSHNDRARTSNKARPTGKRLFTRILKAGRIQANQARKIRSQGPAESVAAVAQMAEDGEGDGPGEDVEQEQRQPPHQQAQPGALAHGIPGDAPDIRQRVDRLVEQEGGAGVLLTDL